MLNAHRSTFKPDATNCLIRNDTTFTTYGSTGLGASADANFSNDDDFFDFSINNTTTFILPSFVPIVRIYLAAGAPDSGCVEYDNPCSVGGAVYTCPSTSKCCPCDQVICCESDGECGVKCTDACDGDEIPFTGQSSNDIEVICNCCNKVYCKDVGGTKECTDLTIGDGNCTSAQTAEACAATCTNEETTWYCPNTTDCGSPVGGVCNACVEVIGNTGPYGSLAECNFKSQCSKTTGTVYTCCADGTCLDLDQPGEVCSAGDNQGTYCTKELCESCEECQAPVASSTMYSSIINSVTTSLPSTKKVAGDSLSSTEVAILNYGVPSFKVMDNISAETARAYNSRLLYVNSINNEIIISGDREITLESTGPDADCDVCLDQGSDAGYKGCGSANPAMYIAEYNIGDLCSANTEVSISVTREFTDNGNEELAVIFKAKPIYNTGLFGDEVILLKDVVTSGFVTGNGNVGTIDCETCDVIFDCAGTTVDHGLYPTLTREITAANRTLYAIPVEQTNFNSTGSGELVKTTNIRNSNHTIGIGIFPIVTTVLAKGNNDDPQEPMYKDTSDDTMIPNCVGGNANHNGNNSDTTIGDRLLDDIDRAASQDDPDSDLYISGTVGSLQNEYGLPHETCANANDVNADGGESLFAAIYTDTSRLL